MESPSVPIMPLKTGPRKECPHQTKWVLQREPPFLSASPEKTKEYQPWNRTSQNTENSPCKQSYKHRNGSKIKTVEPRVTHNTLSRFCTHIILQMLVSGVGFGGWFGGLVWGVWLKRSKNEAKIWPCDVDFPSQVPRESFGYFPKTAQAMV